ncbi:uncharacterized protein [Procambarus clarkii]|uniref:uncharacterized protein n=1 Tax=Procambarus clarkii TaxID=6728 RepID=UPI0037431BB8
MDHTGATSRHSDSSSQEMDHTGATRRHTDSSSQEMDHTGATRRHTDSSSQEMDHTGATRRHTDSSSQEMDHTGATRRHTDSSSQEMDHTGATRRHTDSSSQEMDHTGATRRHTDSSSQKMDHTGATRRHTDSSSQKMDHTGATRRHTDSSSQKMDHTGATRRHTDSSSQKMDHTGATRRHTDSSSQKMDHTGATRRHTDSSSQKMDHTGATRRHTDSSSQEMDHTGATRRHTDSSSQEMDHTGATRRHTDSSSQEMDHTGATRRHTDSSSQKMDHTGATRRHTDSSSQKMDHTGATRRHTDSSSQEMDHTGATRRHTDSSSQEMDHTGATRRHTDSSSQEMDHAGATRLHNATQALMAGVERGDEVLVLAALAQGADTSVTDGDPYDEDPCCMLRLAAKRGHTHLVPHLLAAGLPVEGLGESSYTPLHWAAYNGHDQMVRQLLSAQADLQARDDDGLTALHVAAQNGHKSCVVTLLGAGADPDSRNDYGWSPLHCAANCNHTGVVQVLLTAAGCDRHAVDKRRETALHKAVTGGGLEATQCLVAAGLDLHARGMDGHTPLDVARLAGRGREEWWLKKQLRPHPAAGTPTLPRPHPAAGTPTLPRPHPDAGTPTLPRPHPDAGTPTLPLPHPDAGTPTLLLVVSTLVEASSFRCKPLRMSNSSHFFIPVGSPFSPLVCLASSSPSHPFASPEVGGLVEGVTWTFLPGTTRAALLRWIMEGDAGRLLGNIPQVFDGHQQDHTGRTPLHWAAELGPARVVKVLLEVCRVYPHVLTWAGETPADLALRAGHLQVVDTLHSYHRSKVEGGPGEMYEQLLGVISLCDDIKQAVQLLWSGASLEPLGCWGVSPLCLAVTSNRCRITSLLLAAGAPLTTTFHGLNLLTLAWCSPDITLRLQVTITRVFLHILEQERAKIKELGELGAGVDVVRELGAGVDEVRELSAGVDVVRELGAGVDVVRELGAGVDEVRELSAGVDVVRVLGAGVDEVRELGAGVDVVRELGAGVDVVRELSAGVDVVRELGAGVDVVRVLGAGVDEVRELSAGVDVVRVLGAGVDEVRELSAGVDVVTELSAGVNVVRELGAGVDVVRELGAGVDEVFFHVLVQERDKIKELGELGAGVDVVISTIRGEAPWRACWPRGRSVVSLTQLMVQAARAKCTLTCSFLHLAGAQSSLFSKSGASPLHAALDAGHWELAARMVKNMDGSLYVPDLTGRLPTVTLPPHLARSLEQVSVHALHLTRSLEVSIHAPHITHSLEEDSIHALHLTHSLVEVSIHAPHITPLSGGQYTCSTPRPLSGAGQCTCSTPRPLSGAGQCTCSTPHPLSGAGQCTCSTPRPLSGAGQCTCSTPHPLSGAGQCTCSTPHPLSGAGQCTCSTPHPLTYFCSIYNKERNKLQDLLEKTKHPSDKHQVQKILDVQKTLFTRYLTAEARGVRVWSTGPQALLVASRSGLQQLIYLLVKVGGLAVDTLVDPTAATTALHQAAAHGKSGCVLLLLSLGAQPLLPDRYGHTPPHLAAMFGHQHTYQLLAEFIMDPQPSCRAGTTPQQVCRHFSQYLQKYNIRGTVSSADSEHINNDPTEAAMNLLRRIDLRNLVRDLEKTTVDFTMREAQEVKDEVMRELQQITENVSDKTFRGELRLSGSAADGTRLYCPDEFDVNFVLQKLSGVEVKVIQQTEKEVLASGHKLKVTIKTKNSSLHGNNLVTKFYDRVRECLKNYTIGDKRLSLVPPGLTRTQVGVALSLAWQGSEYPLLLVSVDLVPVVVVPWPKKISRPPLTPDSSQIIQLSNTEDGSWRCSLAATEVEVLQQLEPQERRVFLTCKTLLSRLKAEPWMPRHVKNQFSWWDSRNWKVPTPAGFCLKNSFLRQLQRKREQGIDWHEQDILIIVKSVFRDMCHEMVDPSTGVESLVPAKVNAYFGGDCEKPKMGEGAPEIVSYLDTV